MKTVGGKRLCFQTLSQRTGRAVLIWSSFRCPEVQVIKTGLQGMVELGGVIRSDHFRWVLMHTRSLGKIKHYLALDFCSEFVQFPKTSLFP